MLQYPRLIQGLTLSFAQIGYTCATGGAAAALTVTSTKLIKAAAESTKLPTPVVDIATGGIPAVASTVTGLLATKLGLGQYASRFVTSTGAGVGACIVGGLPAVFTAAAMGGAATLGAKAITEFRKDQSYRQSAQNCFSTENLKEAACVSGGIITGGLAAFSCMAIASSVSGAFSATETSTNDDSPAAKESMGQEQQHARRSQPKSDDPFSSHDKDPTKSPSQPPTENPTTPPPPTGTPTTSTPSAPPSQPPSGSPIDGPTSLPSDGPSTPPTGSPITAAPSGQPSSGPSGSPLTPPPTSTSSEFPSASPSPAPSDQPSPLPTSEPTSPPLSTAPSTSPTGHPVTPAPSGPPSLGPTAPPTTPGATSGPSTSPLTPPPTLQPTAATVNPSFPPSPGPTAPPTLDPSLPPTIMGATSGPSASPLTPVPTVGPTSSPLSTAPSAPPTGHPTTPAPSAAPSPRPTMPPTSTPSLPPTTPGATSGPTVATLEPTFPPSDLPSMPPTEHPITATPSGHPSPAPTAPTTPGATPRPSAAPLTSLPTSQPTVATVEPTFPPSDLPSMPPTEHPITATPSSHPSPAPSAFPSPSPTSNPAVATVEPTLPPSDIPSMPPTGHLITPTPSGNPSPAPTAPPIPNPSLAPIASAPATSVPTQGKVPSNAAPTPTQAPTVAQSKSNSVPDWVLPVGLTAAGIIGGNEVRQSYRAFHRAGKDGIAAGEYAKSKYEQRNVPFGNEATPVETSPPPQVSCADPSDTCGASAAPEADPWLQMVVEGIPLQEDLELPAQEEPPASPAARQALPVTRGKSSTVQFKERQLEIMVEGQSVPASARTVRCWREPLYNWNFKRNFFKTFYHQNPTQVLGPHAAEQTAADAAGPTGSIFSSPESQRRLRPSEGEGHRGAMVEEPDALEQGKGLMPPGVDKDPHGGSFGGCSADSQQYLAVEAAIQGGPYRAASPLADHATGQYQLGSDAVSKGAPF